MRRLLPPDLGDQVEADADPGLRPAPTPEAPAIRPSRSRVRRFSQDEINAAELVLRARPPALRLFDQINMRAGDLLTQISLIAPQLRGQAVAFVGDMDGAAMLLALLRQHGWPSAARLLVLDFDERLLDAVTTFARTHGLSGILEGRLYNVFDPPPTNLVGTFDWFYTNPPYGRYNNGTSARLFITRGCELCKPGSGRGCLILPDDPVRTWTGAAWQATKDFLTDHGWKVRKRHENVHRYHLDDDGELPSCMFQVERHTRLRAERPPMPYAGRPVALDEILCFYGRSVPLPYPRYVRANGEEDYQW